VLSGHYPTTFEEARDLAAIQLQIEEGNHNPAKHKPGSLEYVFAHYLSTSNYSIQIHSFF
jgi:hypothetical protein